MKKIIATTAALACLASIAAAQVTSANIVGYNKASLDDSSGIQIVALQFNVADSTVSGVVGDSLPLGSKIYKFVDGSYSGNISTYGPVFLSGNAWTPDLTIELGSSFWVQVPSTSTNIFAGEVETADSVTNSVVPGLQMLSYPYPVERGIDQLGLTPEVGDKIYKFANGSYTGGISTYGPVFLSGNAWTPALSFGVGEGFWYESTAVTTNDWVVNKPF